MPKKPIITQEDLDAFHRAVEGTKPLIQKKVRMDKRKKPIKHSDRSVLTDEHSETFNFSSGEYLEPLQSEEFISYQTSGIANKILRKLRKGQYNIEAILDLHGKTVDNARLAIDRFLNECLQQELRVVLIIHGKGHHSHVPVLKNKVNHWLRETNSVLAFCSASPAHGSRGATYVLLKRTKQEKED